MSPGVSESTHTTEILTATLFHELRIPISSINGYSSVLLSGELGRVNPGQRQTLKRIQELCQSVIALIGNLLVLVRSGARTTAVGREFVDVAQAAREVSRALEGELRRKKLRFSVRLPARAVRFWGDMGGLTQIFLNLLSNAVKFTPAGGRVRLRLAARPGALAVEVADTGVGIPAAEIPKIFDEFYHVDRSEGEPSPGSGLGLAIVKRIVEGAQGKISVASREGKGTVFRITLPLRPEQQILEEFLEEIWVQAREAAQRMGLILCQLKKSGGRGGRGIKRDFVRAVETLEQHLRDRLRKEDRIFRLSDSMVVGVLVSIQPEEFPILVQRLERFLRESVEMHKLAARGISWRLVAALSPQRGGSPQRLLGRAREQLRRSWRKSTQTRSAVVG